MEIREFIEFIEFVGFVEFAESGDRWRCDRDAVEISWRYSRDAAETQMSDQVQNPKGS